MQYYKQCRLTKGTEVQVVWLPEKFAKLNKYLELQEDKGWENGWKVIEVNKTRLDEKNLLERSQDYKKTRQASDI